MRYLRSCYCSNVLIKFQMFLTEINSTKGVAHRESLALFSSAVLRKIKDQIKEAHKFSDLSDYLETDTLINVPLLVVFSFHYLGNITSGVFKQLLSLTGKVSSYTCN